MNTIQAILQHYQDRINVDQQPFEDQASDLQTKLDELSEITYPVDPVNSVLNGTDPLEAAEWAYSEIKIAEAMELLEQAIERINAQAEKVRLPLAERMNYIVGSYKAVLTLKQTMLKFGNDVPINYKAQFTAECSALAQLMNDAPTELISQLFNEINQINMPETMSQLVA
jgi:hypothetical protein